MLKQNEIPKGKIIMEDQNEIPKGKIKLKDRNKRSK